MSSKFEDYLKQWHASRRNGKSLIYSKSENDSAHTDHVHVSFGFDHKYSDVPKVVSQIVITDLHGKRSIISKYSDGSVGQTYGIDIFHKLHEKYREILQQAERGFLLEGRWTYEPDGEDNSVGYHVVEQASPGDYSIASPIKPIMTFDEARERADEIMGKVTVDLPAEPTGPIIDGPIFSVKQALSDSATNNGEVADVVWRNRPPGDSPIPRLQRDDDGLVRRRPPKKKRKTRRV